ncbi:hypothetical protein HPB48_023173 [Haemaphysalis longicornis]|uniref:Uncharacterized protein n=1 Tax=Haemaphysalis longicornis TaxID=44386 RepID=A0A9J6H6I4_HAELO|nr:hypothetical protein HPB48_023173 [Haemaphysalis longicornis]
MADAGKEDSLLKLPAIRIITIKRQALRALIQNIRAEALAAVTCPQPSGLALKSLLYRLQEHEAKLKQLDKELEPHAAPECLEEEFNTCFEYEEIIIDTRTRLRCALQDGITTEYQRTADVLSGISDSSLVKKSSGNRAPHNSIPTPPITIEYPANEAVPGEASAEDFPTKNREFIRPKHSEKTPNDRDQCQREPPSTVLGQEQLPRGPDYDMLQRIHSARKAAARIGLKNRAKALSPCQTSFASIRPSPKRSTRLAVQLRKRINDWTLYERGKFRRPPKSLIRRTKQTNPRMRQKTPLLSKDPTAEEYSETSTWDLHKYHHRRLLIPKKIGETHEELTFVQQTVIVVDKSGTAHKYVCRKRNRRYKHRWKIKLP